MSALAAPARAATIVAAAGFFLLPGTPGAAHADNRVLRTEFGIGHESQSSPLVQLSPQGTLIRLPGANRLRGSHVRAGVEGFADVGIAEGATASLAGSASAKRAPSEPDFDLVTAAAQPALHAQLAGATVGVGLNLGRIDVARQHFRDIRGVQADLTRADGDSHWSLVADRSSWRHPGEFSDFDTRATTLTLQRHQALAERGGIGSVDFGAVAVRERNRRGFAELSSRGLLLQATLNGQWGPATWSAGGAWHRARFDGSAFAGEPARRDRAWMAEASLQWPLSRQHAVRLEYTGVFTRSNTVLFENVYRQFGVVLASEW